MLKDQEAGRARVFLLMCFLPRDFLQELIGEAKGMKDGNRVRAVFSKVFLWLKYGDLDKEIMDRSKEKDAEKYMGH